VVSGLYFAFLFVCLFFNIGIARFRKIAFEDVPNLTKKAGMVQNFAKADGASAINFVEAADSLEGCMTGLTLSFFLPILVAVLIFIFSEAIEVLIFISAAVTYFSFYKAIRFQLVKRKVAKYKLAKSFGYSLLFTTFTIGFIPIILTIYMLIANRW
jgi:hypothetical protein